MTQQEFNNTIDKYITAHIGLSENAVSSTPMDKGECKVMMKQVFSDFVIPLQKEIDTLKKVYNDLAESHAKQVIEISNIKEENERLDDAETDWFERCSSLESELLKAKERFCQCTEEIKTGSTSAMHCNHCGKIEQSETWLKP